MSWGVELDRGARWDGMDVKWHAIGRDGVRWHGMIVAWIGGKMGGMRVGRDKTGVKLPLHSMLHSRVL